MSIFYKEGYKYLLTRDYQIQTNIFPYETIVHHMFILHKNGLLEIFRNYAWDGATGVPDFKSTMEATLVHDVFCQLMNQDLLDYDTYAPLVHELFGKMCKEGGFWFPDIWRTGVVLGKGGHPNHIDENPEVEAP